MPKRSLVVDIAAVFARNWAIQKAKDQPEKAKEKTIEHIENVSDGEDIKILACDCRGPYWRQVEERGGWISYKGNREPKSDEYKEILRATAKELKARGFTVLSHDLYEADDICATIADQAEDLGINVRLVTSDKDIMQCLRTPQATAGHVDLINVATTAEGNPLWTAGRWFEETGIKPEEVPVYLGLIGDTCDGLGGVSGIGKKTAIGIIKKARSNLKEKIESGDHVPYVIATDLTVADMTDKQWDRLQTTGEVEKDGTIVLPDFYHQVELNTLTTNVPIDVKAAIEGRKPVQQSSKTAAKDTSEKQPGKEDDIQDTSQPVKLAQPEPLKLPESPNLEAGLLVAQKAVEPIGFDGWNDRQKYSYSSAYAIQQACAKALVAAGLLVRRYTWRYDQQSQMVISYIKVSHPASGEHEYHELPFPVIENKGRPFDKALNAALTTSWGFWLLGFLNLARKDQEEVCGRDDQDYQPQQGDKWHNRQYD